jgi:hypothetical protein
MFLAMVTHLPHGLADSQGLAIVIIINIRKLMFTAQ